MSAVGRSELASIAGGVSAYGKTSCSFEGEGIIEALSARSHNLGKTKSRDHREGLTNFLTFRLLVVLPVVQLQVEPRSQ